MKQNIFHVTVGAIFSIIAILHLLRILYDWDAIIGGWAVPMWLSWAAVVVAAFLAYHAFRSSRAIS